MPVASSYRANRLWQRGEITGGTEEAWVRMNIQTERERENVTPSVKGCSEKSDQICPLRIISIAQLPICIKRRNYLEKSKLNYKRKNPRQYASSIVSNKTKLMMFFLKAQSATGTKLNFEASLVAKLTNINLKIKTGFLCRLLGHSTISPKSPNCRSTFDSTRTYSLYKTEVRSSRDLEAVIRIKEVFPSRILQHVHIATLLHCAECFLT